MKCSYCEKEYPDQDMGSYKGRQVCFKCATDRGLPADFADFLSDNPDSYGEDALLKPKEKEPGNVAIAFLISLAAAGGAVWFWYTDPMQLGELKTAVYVPAGLLSGLLVRLLQKGRGTTYQNITGILLMVSFFIPQIITLLREGMFEPLSLMKSFLWLVLGVMASYLVLLGPARK